MVDRKMKTPAEMRAEIEGAGADSTDRLSTKYTFHIDETVRGRRFQGDFVFEVPTLADQIMIGQLKNKYLPGGGLADPPSAALVEYICYLEVTLKVKPTWWQPMEFTEANLVIKVYTEVLRYANRFLGRDAGRGDADEVDGREDDGGSDSDDEGDVDSPVPSAEQRSTIARTHRTGTE